MTRQNSILGVFSYLDDLLKAIEQARERGMHVETVYSPCPNHEIQEAMSMKPSSVRFFTLTGGILGILFGVGLVIYTSLQWKLIVSGKPIVPLVPAVVVGFEFCILFSVLFTVAGLLFKSRLPRLGIPAHYREGFSQDEFGLLLLCSPEERGTVSEFLKAAGAKEVHELPS